MRELLSSYSTIMSADMSDDLFSIKMDNDVMRIEVDLEENAVLNLNAQKSLSKKIKRLLREQMNYEGDYMLIEAIPF